MTPGVPHVWFEFLNLYPGVLMLSLLLNLRLWTFYSFRHLISARYAMIRELTPRAPQLGSWMIDRHFWWRHESQVFSILSIARIRNHFLAEGHRIIRFAYVNPGERYNSAR